MAKIPTVLELGRPAILPGWKTAGAPATPTVAPATTAELFGRMSVYDHAELTAGRARFWLAMDGWTADEAAHLLCGIDPRALRHWHELNGGELVLDFPLQFDPLADMLKSAGGKAGALQFPSKPADVLKWAMSKGMRLPAPLVPPGAVVRGGVWVEAPADVAHEPPAPAAATSATHKIKRRAAPLSAVLAEAKRRALDATDWASAWAALVKLAEPASRPAPLLGYVEGEGVKYRSDKADAPDAYLSRDAFRKRFARTT